MVICVKMVPKNTPLTYNYGGAMVRFAHELLFYEIYSYLSLSEATETLSKHQHAKIELFKNTEVTS